MADKKYYPLSIIQDYFCVPADINRKSGKADGEISPTLNLGIFIEKDFNADFARKAFLKLFDYDDILKIKFVKSGLFGVKQYFSEDIAENEIITYKNMKDRAEFENYCRFGEYPSIHLYDSCQVRAEICETSDGGGIIIYCSHVISDGYALSGVLYPQFCKNYLSLLSGEEMPNSNRESSYEEYLNEENSEKKKEKRKNDSRIWKEEFSKHIENFKIPTKFTLDYKSYEKSFILNEEEGEKAENFAKSLSCSPFAFFFAAYALALAQTFGIDCFSVSTDFVGRITLKEKNLFAPLDRSVPLFFDFSNKNEEDKSPREIEKLVPSTNIRFLSSASRSALPRNKFEYEFFFKQRKKSVGFIKESEWAKINYYIPPKKQEGFPIFESEDLKQIHDIYLAIDELDGKKKKFRLCVNEAVISRETADTLAGILERLIKLTF